MKETIVRIKNPEMYKVKEYGILQQKMNETSVINFNSNMCGLCVNIVHSDYEIISPQNCKLVNGKIIVYRNGVEINTGLELWEK